MLIALADMQHGAGATATGRTDGRESFKPALLRGHRSQVAVVGDRWTELGLAQLRSVDLALMDGASPAEAMRAAEKSTSAEPEAPAASLASEARDAKAARTELDSQSETKDAPTRAEKADGSL